MATLHIVNPQASTLITPVSLADRVGDLSGKTVGLYWNLKAVLLKKSAVSTLLKYLRLSVYWMARLHHGFQPARGQRGPKRLPRAFPPGAHAARQCDVSPGTGRGVRGRCRSCHHVSSRPFQTMRR